MYRKFLHSFFSPIMNLDKIHSNIKWFKLSWDNTLLYIAFIYVTPSSIDEALNLYSVLKD